MERFRLRLTYPAFELSRVKIDGISGLNVIIDGNEVPCYSKDIGYYNDIKHAKKTAIEALTKEVEEAKEKLQIARERLRLAKKITEKNVPYSRSKF
jgi:hypothetical protein